MWTRLLLVLALLLGAAPAWAAPTFDAAVSNPAGGVSPISWSHTTTGTDRVLLVGCSIDQQADANASATYNSVSMTRIVNLTAQQYLAVFRLTAPATGANTVEVTWTGGTTPACISVSYTGVDQTTPNDTPITSESASATSVSDNVTSATGDLVVDFISVNNNAPANTDYVPGASQTERGQVIGASGETGSAGSEEAGAGTVTMSYSWTNAQRAAHAAFNLNAVPTGGGCRRLMLLGVC